MHPVINVNTTYEHHIMVASNVHNCKRTSSNSGIKWTQDYDVNTKTKRRNIVASNVHPVISVNATYEHHIMVASNAHKAITKYCKRQKNAKL